MLDGPRLCVPWQIVTFPTDVNGVGSVRTGAFIAGYMSCFQMSPHSLWTSLRGMVASGNNKTMRFHDRFGGDSFMVWVMFCFSGQQCLCSLCMNHQCSTPAAQHLLNTTASNEPRPFPHLTCVGHDREMCVSMSKIAELGEVLQEWNRLPQPAIGRIICCMLHRLNECQTNITHHW